jgi:hypothetical protein
MKIEEKGDETFGDSDFLAMNDMAIQNFRKNQNESKRNIVKKMLTLQHNMKYNKHLSSVYMKAKELFDKMVEEHRSQLHSLDEIYRHLNHIIRENISKKRLDSKNSMSSEMMKELVKDKKRIGGLVKKMRNSYEKLMNVNTIIGVTIDKINEITLIDDDDHDDEDEDEDEDEDVGEYDDEEGEGDEEEDDEEEEEGDGDEEDDDAEDDDDEEDEEDDEEGDEEEQEEEDDDAEDDEEDEGDEEEDAEDDEEDDEEDDDNAEDDDAEDDDAEEDEEDEDAPDHPNRPIYVF